MRTASATFRAASLELLRNLAMGQDGSVALGGTHFVRCLRSDLTGQPCGFQPEVVRQQLRALAIVDTARARAKGYSHRVGFAEFIRRWVRTNIRYCKLNILKVKFKLILSQLNQLLNLLSLNFIDPMLVHVLILLLRFHAVNRFCKV